MYVCVRDSKAHISGEYFRLLTECVCLYGWRHVKFKNGRLISPLNVVFKVRGLVVDWCVVILTKWNFGQY